MKIPTPKAGLWLVTLLLVGATVAAAQVSPAQVLFSSRGYPGKLDAPSVLNASKTSEVESAAEVTTGPSLPDAPSAMAKGLPTEDPVTPPTQSQGRAPRMDSDTPIGSAFWVANGALLGSTIANAEMITRCRPTSCQSVPDAIRTRGALYAIGIPATIGATYISYRLKRSGTKMWIVPVALLTVGNIVYAVHASQWSKPPGR
jgi:hypothetical protein